MFGELRSILLAIKERRGEWAKVSPAIAVPISDGISLLEKYHDCVKENDIYYIASVLDPRIKTKWLKTLPDGEKIIDRIRAFLKKAYPTPKQPASIAPSSTNYKSFEYRFLEAFQPTQYNVAEPDIDQYFGTPTISTGFDISQSQTEFIRSWWKANRLEFSCTAKVAQDRLAIPAAEVDVERLFNDGRDVLGIRRFSMKGKTLGALIRLKEGYVGSLNSSIVMISSGIHAFDILDQICRSLLVGTGHFENSFHKPFSLKKLDIDSRTCSKFANFVESNRP
jgi:hypothetical protein